MKTLRITIATLLLTLIIASSVFSFASCSPKADTETEIKIIALNGTTGMGIAPLISEVKNGTAKYNYKIETVASADLVSAPLISGTVDIAAVPSNLASVLYNKTSGKIRTIALNTLGVLYLVENGQSVTDFASLAGKTVYLPGMGTNPEYIFRYLLEKAGIADSVTLDFTYNSPDALATAVTAGEASIALLPEPKVSVVLTQNTALRIVADCTAEWEKYEPKNSLVQGCLVATDKFITEHPDLIDAFLADYKRSVEFVNENHTEASVMIAEAGIIPKAPIAEKAIDRCNICYIDGEDMKTAMSVFFGIMYEAAPASVGGALPDDKIFYIGKQ